ncbi:MAG TPA: hypothetical protein VFZ53_21530 [Polyangiaceae bacterium]
MARSRAGLYVWGAWVSALTGCAFEDESRSLAPAAASVRPDTSTRDAARAQALEALRAEESALRARTDFARLPPSSRALGANPYALVALPQTEQGNIGSGKAAFAGVLRGDSAVVLLDGDAKELARRAAPLSPNALGVVPDGRLFVVGDVEERVARYRRVGTRLFSDGELTIPGARSLRAIAADPRALVVADFWGDRLYAQRLSDTPRDAGWAALPTCGGPVRLSATERYLGVVCLFDHSVALYERTSDGLVAREIKRIVHDGPIYAASLLEQRGSLYVAAGGVEDHPLDRRDKAFGYVDSFVYLYRLDGDRRLERLAALNTSELGVVTPKRTELVASDTGVRIEVLGYASERALELEWNELSPGALGVRSERPVLPGCAGVASASGRALCANPLFDGWVSFDGAGARLVRVPALATTEPSASERLGEALFFTTLMAPDVTSAGRRSRFTCETCHFEGGTDGRVHHSGRGDVRVSTRPLLGLFNGAPHFSRAHDADLTSVSDNEFRVANRGNPVDPWFALSAARFPWLAELGLESGALEPLELRRALLVFLARFSHAENPLAVRRPAPRRFDDTERLGAEIFRERCVGCHAARLVARDAGTEVPFERWETLVLSREGPIVWSNGEYAKTGVVPYVDPMGTRAPSLRRLYLKRPYLTNGSARSLAELLRAVRFDAEGLVHGSSEAAANRGLLDAEQREALIAFLELL